MISAKVKIVFLRESTVGKTSIIASYSKGDFQRDTMAMIGAIFSLHLVRFLTMEIKLKIWDTAGQERSEAGTSENLRATAVPQFAFG